MTHRMQMRDRELDGGDVVHRDEGRVEVRVVAVHEEERDTCHAQALVPSLVRRDIAMAAGDEDRAGDFEVEQHLDVLVLGGAGELPIP